MEFNHYYTNEELEAVLKSWEIAYPGLVCLSSLGNSFQNRPIWLVTLTNHDSGPDLNKPAIWLDGNIHATELAGTTTSLCVIHHMLEGFGTDNQITRLLNNSAFYIVPRVNPDGAAAAMDSNPRYLRSSVRPYPLLEPDEGLQVQDINGDSRILQMRILDPAGDWKPYEKDPRFMVKREPADVGGNYYRILPEGLIDSYDGYLIKFARPTSTLDLNRNFPFEWRTEDEQEGAGPFPASEPEIGAVVRFISDHRNISFGLTFHTFSRVLLRPFSTKADDQMDIRDLEVFKTIGSLGTQITGYRNVSTFHDFTYNPKDVTTGAFDDWLYDHLGAFVFTVELWDLPTEAGIKDRKIIQWFYKHPLEDDLQILKWVDEHVGPDGYVAWQPFQHPQLGQIEIGGWNSMYTWRNPPPAFMGSEAQRHVPYILTLAELLPQISIHTFKTSQLSGQTWSVDLVVENTGYLPTYTSQQARKRQVARPVSAQLRLPDGGRFLVGKERMEIGHLEGRSNKEDATSAFAYNPTDNRGRIQWVIECTPGSIIDLTVTSDRGGKIKKQVLLEKSDI